MMCPDSDCECDNPGCRRGGCQGRRPELPLLRAQGAPPGAYELALFRQRARAGAPSADSAAGSG